ncbi:hypothetical protein F511_46614 [Dorcoceras hygrometricum]|uniref:Uncharacterized protein n=1 Tax=Dorcoceras hygrometricum TaxID=472368 RepID=A0A2Z6ZU51_9LAMI|nr:hypothetical protein F511_46614 [Dorcoceras hygrometricum]
MVEAAHGAALAHTSLHITAPLRALAVRPPHENRPRRRATRERAGRTLLACCRHWSRLAGRCWSMIVRRSMVAGRAVASCVVRCRRDFCHGGGAAGAGRRSGEVSGVIVTAGLNSFRV